MITLMKKHMSLVASLESQSNDVYLVSCIHKEANCTKIGIAVMTTMLAMSSTLVDAIKEYIQLALPCILSVCMYSVSTVRRQFFWKLTRIDE